MRTPAAGARHPWWIAIVAALALGIATAALYAPTSRGEFVWDDAGLLGADNASVDTWSDAITGFARPVLSNVGVGYYRPVLTATLVADYQYGGANPAQFHRTNVALHAVNAALVLLLLFVFVGDVRAAAVGAWLFAAHPIQVQAVALVLGRNDELLVPPVVAMLLADELCERRGRRLLGILLVGVFYAFALFTKETAVIAPAFILLGDVLWRGRPWRQLGGRLPLLVVVAVVALGYFAARLTVMGALVDSGQYGTLGPLGRLALATATLGYYLRLLVVPWGFAPAPYHPGLVDPGQWRLWVAALWSLAGLTITFAAVRRAPRIAYGLVFFLVASLPVLGIAALMKVPLLEHRTYLPMVGIGFAAAALVALRRWSPPAAIATVAVLVGLTLLSALRLPSYATSLSLWGMGVANAPAAAYARNNYAAALMDADRYAEAVEQLREALRLDPAYHRARYNLAGCLEYLGQRDEAIKELEVIAEQRSDSSVQNRLGLMRSRAGDLAKARLAFEKAVAISPDDVAILRNLYDLLARQRQYADAVQPAERLAALRPDVAESWWRLGVTLRQARRPAEAVPALERAAQLRPPPGALELELAHALWEAGRGTEAATHAARARSLGAADAAFFQLLRDAGLLDTPQS